MTNITMPQLGESVTEGTITKWLVKPGDTVSKYDPIAEVMTDKVNAEIPSSYTGTIKEIIANEDETIAVGEVICTMEAEGEVVKEDTSNEISTNSERLIEDSDEKIEKSASKNRYSPAVLRLAQEHEIDLREVAGSGRGGRITRKDILTFIEKGENQLVEQSNTSLETDEKQREPQNKTVSQHLGRVEEIPVSGVRKAIANNLVKSKHEAPHAWMMIEVDVTNLVNHRNKIKDEFYRNENLKLTFLPFFMRAIVDALKAFPEVNSSWAGDKIIRHKDVHISLAVATETDLYVPVIKHAEEKSIKGLAREIHEVAKKVRTKNISQTEMEGGTFTVNNTGSFGSIQSQPILNYPQAAILSIESIVKRPVVVENDAIAIRHMVNLCMSLDHRVLDGVICGKFLAHVKDSLENINEKNTSLY
ncbi:dihydrolipoamide acetyltransferase family protein [Evansella cellulosilytica]|uniref:Dihydrolipoamide acetyltransferase component of pyruvate dehydrogenase complex n=1 Tax=Evansella cellulosilytica (strain ATCC 21833 / DSM 2522 / FERM P-1141 / JCM 9156 / N-4) TaxID=649639 RepID=E6TXS3_EVAC2|nr:dihydrolipoamide acetyltransferase family protein [Evansella cellulosilytica]ADU29999.1 catalytic domain-containing protein of components of various dehydrogenase complexes [Evansella cellulosilytica DSM 2522]